MKRGLFLLAIALLPIAVQGQAIVWEKWDPMTVRTNRTADVALDLQTSGAVSGVRIDYAGGGSTALTLAAPNRWTASVPAAKALFDYQADDVNHNFVGFIRLLGPSGDTLITYNAFVQVIDNRVPSVFVRDLGGSARATERILNLYRPGIGMSDVQAAAQLFYGYYRDDYDFLQVVFSVPSYPANRYHFAVRSDVDGIGMQKFNLAPAHGSAGRLQGITVFPVDFFFDTAETGFSHELGHQWVMFLKNPVLQPGPHWPPSTMARGIMGFNIPGSSVGGEFGWEITAVTGSTARTATASPTQEFTDFDLYLMGFLTASAVPPGIVLRATPCNGCVLPSTTITISDVIAANGARSPDWNAAKKSFRIATIVISRDRLLNDDEMAALEYFAARGEAETPLPYTLGFGRGMTKPFYLATRGLGRVDFRLEHFPRRRTVRH